MSSAGFSVIIPCYNAGKYVYKIISDLINQTFKEFEVIFVNDNSKDNTLEIINEVCAIDSRFKVINNEVNLGPNCSRENGLRAAKKDFVLFVDADDRIANTYLEEFAKKASNKDIVVCDYSIIKDMNDERKIVETTSIESDLTFYIKEMILTHKTNSLWAKCFRRALFDDIALNTPYRVGEDLLTCVEAFKKAKSIETINKTLYFYLLREDSMMGNKTYRTDVIDVINLLLEKYPDLEKELSLRKMLEYRRVYYLLDEDKKKVAEEFFKSFKYKKNLSFKEKTFLKWHKNKIFQSFLKRHYE